MRHRIERKHLTLRLLDYGLVALVILVVVVLFRLSRSLMNRVMSRLERDGVPLSADRILVTGLMFLLCGLLFLPFFTSVLAFFSRESLPGGMILHLFLVALSVIFFSIAEDLFRVFSSYPSDRPWTRSKHMKTVALPLLVFWGIGCLLLSPVFYSGLTIILTLFYLFALACRPSVEKGGEG